MQIYIISIHRYEDIWMQTCIAPDIIMLYYLTKFTGGCILVVQWISKILVTDIKY